MEDAIKEKISQEFTGRVTAGFCWEWSKELNPDRTLKNDVVISDYKRPWNARYEATGLTGTNIPKASYWAYDPNGINQIGFIPHRDLNLITLE